MTYFARLQCARAEWKFLASNKTFYLTSLLLKTEMIYIYIRTATAIAITRFKLSKIGVFLKNDSTVGKILRYLKTWPK